MKPGLDDELLKYVDTRPAFFDTPGVDHLFSMCMALAEQLAVANERHDTLMRVLLAKGVITADEIASFEPDTETLQARSAQHEALIQQVLQSLDDELDRRGAKK